MKKKVISHIVDVAIENPKFMYQYADGEHIYVTDGHRAIRYREQINSNPQIKINAHSSVLGPIREKLNRMDSCVKYELPSKEDIKAGITEVAGKAYSVKVAWGNDKFAVNARFLVKAMDALNATVCYIDERNPGMSGIYLFEDDNLLGEVCEIIMPVSKIKYPNKTGFWKM